jgi:prepilin-type N-terminal cleavage/methylation domain-containing protein
MHTKSGFSIIELVLVIAVIAILCYFVVPQGHVSAPTINPTVIKHEVSNLASGQNIQILKDAYDRAKMENPACIQAVENNSVENLILALEKANYIGHMGALNIKVKEGTSIAGGTAEFIIGE